MRATNASSGALRLPATPQLRDNLPPPDGLPRKQSKTTAASPADNQRATSQEQTDSSRLFITTVKRQFFPEHGPEIARTGLGGPHDEPWVGTAP